MKKNESLFINRFIEMTEKFDGLDSAMSSIELLVEDNLDEFDFYSIECTKLLHARIEETLIEFKHLEKRAVDKKYNEFFLSLKEKFPELDNSEIRKLTAKDLQEGIK